MSGELLLENNHSAAIKNMCYNFLLASFTCISSNSVNHADLTLGFRELMPNPNGSEAIFGYKIAGQEKSKGKKWCWWH